MANEQLRLDLDFSWANVPILSELRRLMGVLESRLTPLENEVIDWEQAVTSLREVGLYRLDEVLGPLLQTLSNAARLGFLVGYAIGVERSLAQDEVVDFVINSDGFEMFTPTPYLLAVDLYDPSNWGIVTLSQYVPETGELQCVVNYASQTLASDSWSVSCNSATLPLMMDLLNSCISSRDEASSSVDYINSLIGNLEALIAAVQEGPVAAVAGKTGNVTLAISDIVDLVTTLADKISTSSFNSALSGKQSASAKLSAIANFTWSADQLLYLTGPQTVGNAPLTEFGRGLIGLGDLNYFFTAIGVSSFVQTLLNTNQSEFRNTLGVPASITEISTVATTTYTIASSDNCKVIRFTSNSSITVTLPNNLPKGFSCLIAQRGSGVITFSAGVGAVRNSRGSRYKTAGIYAEASILVEDNASGSSAYYLLSGDLTT